MDPQPRLTWTTSLSGEEAKAQEGVRVSPVSCRPGVGPTEWVRGPGEALAVSSCLQTCSPGFLGKLLSAWGWAWGLGHLFEPRVSIDGIRLPVVLFPTSLEPGV